MLCLALLEIYGPAKPYIKIPWAMSDYLQYKFEDSEASVSTFDEAPLWSAAFGLLLLKHLSLQNVKEVVDAGCGTGFPLFELAGRLGMDAKLYGIDPWNNAMLRAKQKQENYGYANVELIAASAEEIPLNDNAVDLVVSNLGINNFARPALVFAECYRVLK
jgi:arsenite methyltransferase